MKWSIVVLFFAFFAFISAETVKCPKGEHFRKVETQQLVDGKWIKDTKEKCTPCKDGYDSKSVQVHYKTVDGVWKDKTEQRCIKIPTHYPKCSKDQNAVTVIKRVKLEKGWKVKMVTKCMEKCKSGFEAKHITVLSRKKGESTWKKKRARRCIPITPALTCKEGYKPVKRLVRSIFNDGKVSVRLTQKCESKCAKGFVLTKVSVRTSTGATSTTKCAPKPTLKCLAPGKTHRTMFSRQLKNGKVRVRYVEKCLCPSGFQAKRKFAKTYGCVELMPNPFTTNGVMHCPQGYKVKYSIKAVTKNVDGESVARPEGKFTCVRDSECKKGFAKKNVVVKTHGQAVRTALCVPAHNPCPKGHRHKLHYKSVLMPSGTSFKSQLEFTHKCINPCKPGFSIHKVKVTFNGVTKIEKRCAPNSKLQCVSPARRVRHMTRTLLKSGKHNVVYNEKCVCPFSLSAYRRKNRVICKRRKVKVQGFSCPKGESSKYEVFAVLKKLKNGKQVARPVGKLTCTKDSTCKTGFKKKTVSIVSHGAAHRTVLCVPALNPCPNGYRHKFSYKASIQNGKAVLNTTHKCILKPCKSGFKKERVAVKTSKGIEFAVKCVPKPVLVCKQPSKRYRRMKRTKLPNGKYRVQYTERCICPAKSRAVKSGHVVTCKPTGNASSGTFKCPKGQKARYVVKPIIRFVKGRKVARPSSKLECVSSKPCKTGHSHKFVTIRSHKSHRRAYLCVPNANCAKTHRQRLKIKAFIHKSGQPKLKYTHSCVRKPCKAGFERKSVKVISKNGTTRTVRCVPKRKLICVGGVAFRRLVRRKQPNGKFKVKYTEKCLCAKRTKTIKNGNVVECVISPRTTGGRIKCPNGKKLKFTVVASTRKVNGKVVAFPKPFLKCVDKTACKTGFESKNVKLRIHGKIRRGRLCVPKSKVCPFGQRNKLKIKAVIKKGKAFLHKTHVCVQICRPGRTFKRVVVRRNKKRYFTFKCLPNPELICKGGVHVRRIRRKKLPNGKVKSKYHESCKCPHGLSAHMKGNYIECRKKRLTELERLKIKMKGQLKKAQILQEQIDALQCDAATKQLLQQVKTQIIIKQKLIQKLEDKK